MDEVEERWDAGMGEDGGEEASAGYQNAGGQQSVPPYGHQTYPNNAYQEHYGVYHPQQMPGLHDRSGYQATYQANPYNTGAGYGYGYGYGNQQQGYVSSNSTPRPNVAASAFTPRAARATGDYYDQRGQPARAGVLSLPSRPNESTAATSAQQAPQPAVKSSTAAGGNRVLTIGGPSTPRQDAETKKGAESAPGSGEKKSSLETSTSKTTTGMASSATKGSVSATPGPAPESTSEAAGVTRGADAVAEDLTAAADEETLKDLYGGYESLALVKEHVNIVFIGHVDAGKSTMGGNILFLTGMVDKRTMEKYEKEAKDVGRESWYLSWALDSTTQERAKGKTVEVGRGYFETEKRRYTILDAPGHKNYVPSMIGGAAQADVAVLVISARRGEFETGFEKGGQTREHAMLVKTAGVNKLIVVINKMDDATVAWDKERYDECVGKLKPFIKGLGFALKTDVEFMPISGYTGANIKDPLTKDVCPWHSGPALLQYLDSMAIVDRKMNAPFMMPISEKYRDKGTIVVGKIEAGRVRKGDTLVLMPNKQNAEVSAIFNEQEEEIQQAICGDNIRLRLRGPTEDDVVVGFVLSDKRKPVHVVTHFEAQLAILEHKSIICGGYSAVMHVHTSVQEIRLEELLHYFDKKTGRKSKKAPQFAKKGMKIIAVVVTDSPICLETFTDFPSMGRFTVRDEGRTIAIGRVTRLLEREAIPTAETVNANADARAADAAAAAQELNGA